ncbi:hypothetical protein BKA62DRAFT_754395 [Auriculariales sp. MPI-PUGE-AT-0066]|nr:hypothetical protein BKA62DRAFT_754395 [Auriculariales sp. MPI-PUGE-AT-0066]
MYRLKVRKVDEDDWVPVLVKPEIIREYRATRNETACSLLWDSTGTEIKSKARCINLGSWSTTRRAQSAASAAISTSPSPLMNSGSKPQMCAIESRACSGSLNTPFAIDTNQNWTRRKVHVPANASITGIHA